MQKKVRVRAVQHVLYLMRMMVGKYYSKVLLRDAILIWKRGSVGLVKLMLVQ